MTGLQPEPCVGGETVWDWQRVTTALAHLDVVTIAGSVQLQPGMRQIAPSYPHIYCRGPNTDARDARPVIDHADRDLTRRGRAAPRHHEVVVEEGIERTAEGRERWCLVLADEIAE